MGGVAFDALFFALILGGLWLAVPGWVGTVGAWLLLTTYVAVGVLLLEGTPGPWLVNRIMAVRSAIDDLATDERLAAGEEADATVVPFRRTRRRRRAQRPALDAERQSRAGGEGRARTH
jgi:hypothetical protein